MNMTGSAQVTPQLPAIACCICTRPIPVEDSKTDEHGKAVHEECYVRKMISQSATIRPANLLESWLRTLAGIQRKIHLPDAVE
jgi:hypothetical protein